MLFIDELTERLHVPWSHVVLKVEDVVGLCEPKGES